MKKIILAIIVVIIVFSFTLPLYAWPAQGVPATGDLEKKAAGTNVDNGNLVAYYSSMYIKNGGDFGGTGDDPSHGARGIAIQALLRH